MQKKNTYNQNVIVYIDSTYRPLMRYEKLYPSLIVQIEYQGANQWKSYR